MLSLAVCQTLLLLFSPGLCTQLCLSQSSQDRHLVGRPKLQRHIFRSAHGDAKRNLQHPAWWLIPLSKWVITPVINGISRVNPLVIGVITHLLSGMNYQERIVSDNLKLTNLQSSVIRHVFSQIWWSQNVAKAQIELVAAMSVARWDRSGCLSPRRWQQGVLFTHVCLPSGYD